MILAMLGTSTVSIARTMGCFEMLHPGFAVRAKQSGLQAVMLQRIMRFFHVLHLHWLGHFAANQESVTGLRIPVTDVILDPLNCRQQELIIVGVIDPSAETLTVCLKQAVQCTHNVQQCGHAESTDTSVL